MKNTIKSFKQVSAVFLIAIFILGTATLSGCNAKSSGKLIIWAFDYYIDAAKEAVNEYQSKYSNSVEIEIVELGQSDLVEKFRIALASGKTNSLPDIIFEEYYNLKGYLEYYNDKFVDLTSYIDTSLYVDFTVKSVTYNNRVWGVPYDTGLATWFYRSDIFAEAGFIETDLQNITWDRFVEIGKVIKEKTGKYIIPLVPEGNIEGRIMLQSAGSWYYDENGRLDIENNKAIATMTETIGTLMSSGVVYEVSTWPDIFASFYNEITAGVITGNWGASMISAHNPQFGLWRVAPVPRMSGSSSYTNYSSCGGGAWLVLNKENKEIAIDFLMETLATSNSIADIMIKNETMVPALKSAAKLESAKSGDPYFGNQNLVELMAEWIISIPYVNYGLHPYEIAYFHGSLFPDYLRGDTTVNDVINSLQKQAEIIEKQ